MTIDLSETAVGAERREGGAGFPEAGAGRPEGEGERPEARGLIGRYRLFLSLPGTARLLLSSLSGRLPLGMTSLAVLLLVHQHTGSFATAGVAVGAFTLMSASTTPLQGRLIDRIGGPPVLMGFAIAQAAGLGALVFAAQLGAASAALVVLAAVAGALTPPLSACVRALWPRVAPSTAMLEAAYALDATSQEAIWTSGPLLVAAAIALGSPAVAVLLSGAITVCGTAWFTTAPATRRWRGAGRAARRPSAIRNPGLRIIICATVLTGLGVGAVEVALPGIAVHAGSRPAAGILLGLWSIGSLFGGLVYGSRSWRARLSLRYPALLALVSLTTLPLIFVGTIAAAIPLSLLAGIAFAPTLSCQYTLVGAIAVRSSATVAFAWMSTALVAGIAAGNAAAGPLVQGGGIASAVALGCAATGLAAVIATLRRGTLDVPLSHHESDTVAAVVTR
jgi:predicted MFS family arabinose efflux permease